MEASPTSKRGYLVLVAIALICGLLASRSSSYAQTESVINAFNCITELSTGCEPGDSDVPGDGDFAVNNGVLYGLTYYGGTFWQGGVAYALKPPSTSGGAWTKTVLYDFANSTAYLPISLIAGLGKTLYAVSQSGGATGNAFVFSLEPPANGGTPWVLTELYSFAGGSDGVVGWGLTQDSSGTLYGVSDGGLAGHGKVFSLTPPATSGEAWTEKTLFSFNCKDSAGPGCGPESGLLIGPNGILYGTTGGGGSTGRGAVYALTPPATPDGSWTAGTLYAFQGLTAGLPVGRLVADKNGNLFGSIQVGPSNAEPQTLGSVFELTPPSTTGGAWTEHTLWVFGIEPGDGETPNGVSLVNGSLYGTTFLGGPYGEGAVFQLTPPAALGSPWTENIIHSFSANGTDGYTPNSRLLLGPSGLLYGTTFAGTIYGGLLEFYGGTVFEVTP